MAKVKKYYDMSNLIAENANYNILYGKRGNGKSYQIKKKVLEDFFNHGWTFVYLRRTVNEIKKELVETYFEDFDISEWSDGKYNTIVVKSNKFYLANVTGDFKIILGEKIGYIWSLIHDRNYKSGSYLDVHNIIFEEFMTDALYLRNEPKKLDSIYSTVDRQRNTTKMWLIGNAISRVNPYVNGWKIRETFLKLKVGDIASVEVPVFTNEDEIATKKVAIEYCKNEGGSAGSFTDEMIDGGGFQVEPQPLLPESYKKYKVNFRFVFCYQGFKFICEYLSLNKDCVFFIYPSTSEIKKKTIVIGDIIKPSVYYQRNIYDFKTRNKRLRELLQTFSETNLFFSDHRTGTEFKQLIDFNIRL